MNFVSKFDFSKIFVNLVSHLCRSEGASEEIYVVSKQVLQRIAAFRKGKRVTTPFLKQLCKALRESQQLVIHLNFAKNR